MLTLCYNKEHPEICHEGLRCPICELLDSLEKEKVSPLEDRIADLEEQIDAARKTNDELARANEQFINNTDTLTDRVRELEQLCYEKGLLT